MINIPSDCGESEALAAAKADSAIAPLLEGKTIVKEIYVKGRIVNIAVK